MKKNILLMLLVCGVFLSCNMSQQDKQKADTTKTDKNMTNEQLREKLEMALDDMKAKALEMGIQGVAVAAVLNNGDTVDWIGEMKVVETPCNLKEGHNMVAIAWSKCGEVIATGADSGNPDHEKMLGELGFVGGAYGEYQGCKMAFAFSGAVSEDDLVVARHGIEKLKGYIGE